MHSVLEKVIKSFPHTTIQPIVGQPTYKTLAKVHMKLTKNVASVHSYLENGKLSLLFLTISPAIYNTQSNIAPANTGLSPFIPQNLTAAHIADIRGHYDINSDLYTKYDMTYKALKSFLISGVDETNIQYL